MQPARKRVDVMQTKMAIYIENQPFQANLCGIATASTFEIADIYEARSLISLVCLEDFTPEPGKVVDSDFALLSRNRHQNILTLQHLHLKETPSERKSIEDTSPPAVSMRETSCTASCRDRRSW